MFCTQCGKQNPEGNRFCAGCGAKLAEKTRLSIGLILSLGVMAVLMFAIAIIPRFLPGGEDGNSSGSRTRSENRNSTTTEGRMPLMTERELLFLDITLENISVAAVAPTLICWYYPKFYFKFIENEFTIKKYKPDYDRLVSQLDEERKLSIKKIYVLEISRIDVGRYDFQRQGFPIALPPSLGSVQWSYAVEPKAVLPREGMPKSCSNPNYEGYSITPYLTNQKDFTFLAIEEAQAEKIAGIPLVGRIFWEPERIEVQDKYPFARRIYGKAIKIEVYAHSKVIGVIYAK